MSAVLLDGLRELIQRDVNKRGLAGDLFGACRGDFANACHSIAEHARPSLAVVTGFFIPHAQPPCGETDGPLGALFLARAGQSLGIKVALLTDDFCRAALEIGLQACGLSDSIPAITLTDAVVGQASSLSRLMDKLEACPTTRGFPCTHLLAVERVGPGRDGRCRDMRGHDITDQTAPASLLFEDAARPITIGIGDGGNEIGMGKIPPDVIGRNIPHGEDIACRVPTDHLIVAGVSNWGAYALAAGVAVLRRQCLPASLFDVEGERELLRHMVQGGPLVDGVTAKQTVTVDGLSFEEYAEPLRRIGEMLEREQWLTCEQRAEPT